MEASKARGERFFIPLDDEVGQNDTTSAPAIPFVGDVQERSTSQAEPVAPSLKPSQSGFPKHRKRTGPSVFQRRKDAPHADVGNTSENHNLQQPGGNGLEQLEKRRIHEENTQKLMDMSPKEIEQERQELFEGLPPSLIERLLKRSRIDDESAPKHFYSPQVAAGTDSNDSKDHEPVTTDNDLSQDLDAHGRTGTDTKKVTFDLADSKEEPRPASTAEQPAHDSQEATQDASLHFPSAPQHTLDTNDPAFLDRLHEKYFPNLEHDQSKLDWLTPLPTTDSEEDQQSPYHPSKTDVSPGDIRFNFKGELLPPRLARQLPTNIGLHHHGDAPEAAGYTIPELARLARSQVAAQRSMAYQTLGRILYRLGIGQFGDETQASVEDEGYGDEGAVLAQGLWSLIEAGYVIETLSEEANRKGGHASAKAYAQEALWHWRQGGGRMRKAV